MVPLPAAVVASLEDPTTALAAAFVIASHHPEILIWVSRTICEEPAEPSSRPRAARRRARRKANGGGGRNGVDHRLAGRDEADKQLIEAMKACPSASIGDLAAAIERSRTSLVSGLHRLRDAGLAESVEGRWRLTEEPAPREAAPRWVEPVSATSERHRAHA
jgi:hypothetical protein